MGHATRGRAIGLTSTADAQASRRSTGGWNHQTGHELGGKSGDVDGIQWKDGFGVWHDVDGWRGNFNCAGVVVWYVGPENLNAGPFRWQAYQSEGGAWLATSDAFDLPAFAGQMVTVEISLD